MCRTSLPLFNRCVVAAAAKAKAELRLKRGKEVRHILMLIHCIKVLWVVEHTDPEGKA